MAVRTERDMEYILRDCFGAAEPSINRDIYDTLVARIAADIAVAAPVTFGFAVATGATADHNAISILGSNVKMFPEAAVPVSTATGGDATHLSDSTKAWLTNQFAGFYISALTTEAIFATIASNTGPQVVVDAWTNYAGGAMPPPGAGALYYIIPATVNVYNINGGQGDQLLSLTVQDIFPLLISIVLKHNLGNIRNASGADVTVTPAKRYLYQRDRDTNIYTGFQ
jgi:hypothetical protein